MVNLIIIINIIINTIIIQIDIIFKYNQIIIFVFINTIIRDNICIIYIIYITLKDIFYRNNN